jgi:hypothetical protein
MTMIDGTPANAGELAELKSRLEILEKSEASARLQVRDGREKVQDLFTGLNDYIVANECDEDSSIPFTELDEILDTVYGHKLIFSKTYDVEVALRVLAKFQVMAGDEATAREMVTNIGLADEPFDLYGSDVEQGEAWIDRTTIESIRRA